MTSIVTVLLVISLAVLTNRIATVALALTGVSRELARFQSRSALTGVGFTSEEAESVVNHPVRRRIIAMLMLLGSAGVITAIASVVVSFVDIGREDVWWRVGVLAAGLAALWGLATSQWLKQRLDPLIEQALDRWTDLRVRDYVNMLHLSEDYQVSELQVDSGDWLADKTLGQLNVGKEGVHVLGITRANETYVGAPAGDTKIRPGDRLLIYGRAEVLDELDQRRADAAGEAQHLDSVEREQQRLVAEGSRACLKTRFVT